MWHNLKNRRKEMRLKIREAMGLRQAMGRPIGVRELAEKVFPKKPFDSRYQCLRRLMVGEATAIKFDTLIRLSKELGVSTDYLLGLED